MKMFFRYMSIALVGASSLCLAGTDPSGTEWSKEFRISGKADLRVEVDDGRVTVIGSDSNRVEARVSLSGWRFGTGGVQVIDRQSGDHVELDVRVPHEMHFFNIGNQSVRVELRVPVGVTADIHTHDGAIIAENLHGGLRLRTGDGHIEATRVDGTLDANTGDGSIRVRGRLDNMSLHTGDGSVEAELDNGSKMVSGWDVSTGDGHITLRLPEGFGAELDAHTNDGSINVDFPLSTTHTSGGHDARGKMGPGGPILKIRTGDGSIKLARS
jgi:DUF4097 and DUF4098 domain-containing protein YvlB